MEDTEGIWRIRYSEEVTYVLQAVDRLLTAHKYSETDRFCFRLALEEAMVNGITHGNQRDPAKNVTIEILRLTPHDFTVRITDQGTGFDPRKVPDLRLPKNLDRPHGRGLLLMRTYMRTRFLRPGNSVILSRKKPKQQ